MWVKDGHGEASGTGFRGEGQAGTEIEGVFMISVALLEAGTVPVAT